ncbi:hypothetical protein B296_00016045 [Ensete ventricosum]|uniref:cytokinin riboside 5'-monophosphate phosphoribohydrolase n=1 Tax=Ensete ventricosum TaxID=4639 RepID=A0A426YRE1_ENSVE|nr:hypothetical protein B296_00016045 [Ensete ventricosum]
METEAQALPMTKRPSTSRFRRVCVFCGSSPGKKASYQLAAIQLGHELVSPLIFKPSIPSPNATHDGLRFVLCFALGVASCFSVLQVQRNIDLVYGGGSVGLMGLVSQAVHEGGRHVLGYSPSLSVYCVRQYITGESVGEVRAVSGMHQRKAEMARQADAFIALPGKHHLCCAKRRFDHASCCWFGYLGGYGTLEELLEVITWAQLGIHDKPVGLLNVDGYYNSLLSFIDKAVDEGFITPTARRIIVSAQTAHELLYKLEVPTAQLLFC